MDTIKIRKDANGYTAIMIDGQSKAEAIELFGTSEIPTGFTEKANSNTVLSKIRALNLDCNVILA